MPAVSRSHSGGFKTDPVLREMIEFRQESERLRAASEACRSEHSRLRVELRNTVSQLHTTAEAMNGASQPSGPETPPLGLTKREIEVLALIATSHSTKDIAYRLGITFKTAVTHRTSIMEKLNLHDVSALTRFAIRNSVIPA